MGDVYTNPPQSRNEAILRATIDGTEYTAPPQSRIEDLLLELKEAIEQGGTGEGDMKKSVYDSDNSVATAGGIAAYVDDEITDLHLGTASTKNSTSVVTESSDLVESGAVFDAIQAQEQLLEDTVGWSGKNLLNYKTTPVEYYTTTTLIDNGIKVKSNSAGIWRNSFYRISNSIKNKNVDFSCILDYVSGNGRVVIKSGTLSTEGNLLAQSNIISSDTNVNLSFNTGNEDYLYIHFYVTLNDSMNGELNATNIMLKLTDILGDDYEPYHESVEEYIPQVVSDAVGWDVGNQLKTPYYQSSVSGDIPITVNNDGSITLGSGTATTTEKLVIRNTTEAFKPPKGIYKLSKGFSSTVIGLVAEAYNGGSWVKAFPMSYSVDEQTINIDYDGYDRIVVSLSISANATSTGLTVNPKLLHISVDEQKCDNSVIAPTENGSTASQAYAVGSHAIRNGAFITWKNAKAQGEPINDANDYTSGDVASALNNIRDVRIGIFSFANGTVASGTVLFDKPFDDDVDSNKMVVFITPLSGSDYYMYAPQASNLLKTGFNYLMKNIGSDTTTQTSRQAVYMAIVFK